MNGAVHGVASIVVMMPLRNAPSGPSLRGGRLNRAAAEKAGDRNFPHAEQAQRHREHDGQRSSR